MPAVDKSGKGGKGVPVSVTGATIAVGRQVLQSEIVRQTAQQHVLSQLERLQAKGQAMRYAEQTNCEAALVQYPDGPERWTIFKDGEPLLAFPVYDGEIASALRFHDISRLKMRKPAELAEEIKQERQRRKERLQPWRKGKDASTSGPPVDDPISEELDRDAAFAQ